MARGNRGRWLKWISLPVFIFVLIAAYVNYNSINRAEAVYVSNTTNHVAEVVQSEIQRVIEFPLLMLDQMGQEWIRDGGFRYVHWQFLAQNFLHLFSSVQSIEWIDSQHAIRWIAPYKPNADLIDANLDKFPGTVNVLHQVKKNKSLLLTPAVKLLEGGTGFLAVKGVYDEKHQSSAIAAVFNADKLFHPLLRQSLFHGYHFTIQQEGAMLYQRGKPINVNTAPFIKTLTLHMKNVDWVLTVWPSQGVVANMRSSAPQNVFFSGCIIACILATLFYLAGQKIQLGEDSIRIAHEIGEMKNEFISVVSHELRTPLTAIKGSISLLVDDDRVDLSDKSTKLLTIAKKNCDRLILLINDILDLEKIESGTFELRNKKFKIMSLVEEAVRANETFASNYQVKLAINSNCNVTVFADYDKLIQVLTNLISNAVKFSKSDALVTVHVRSVSKNIVLAVQDTGDGIPKAFYHKIFGKFAQADSSSGREKGGTGLGLSICKSIVEMHKGRIEFESSEGKGTTFSVILPVLAAESYVQRADQVEQEVPPRDQEKIYILHVEDDPDVLKITQILLEPEAHVASAKSLKQVKKMLKKYNYDLVILDIALPDGDGASLLPIINLNTKKLTPVIVFSSYEIGQHVRQYVSAELVKSLTSNELLINTVRKILRCRDA